MATAAVDGVNGFRPMIEIPITQYRKVTQYAVVRDDNNIEYVSGDHVQKIYEGTIKGVKTTWVTFKPDFLSFAKKYYGKGEYFVSRKEKGGYSYRPDLRSKTNDRFASFGSVAQKTAATIEGKQITLIKLNDKQHSVPGLFRVVDKVDRLFSSSPTPSVSSIPERRSLSNGVVFLPKKSQKELPARGKGSYHVHTDFAGHRGRIASVAADHVQGVEDAIVFFPNTRESFNAQLVKFSPEFYEMGLHKRFGIPQKAHHCYILKDVVHRQLRTPTPPVSSSPSLPSRPATPSEKGASPALSTSSRSIAHKKGQSEDGILVSPLFEDKVSTATTKSGNSSPSSTKGISPKALHLSSHATTGYRVDSPHLPAPKRSLDPNRVALHLRKKDALAAIEEK